MEESQQTQADDDQQLPQQIHVVGDDLYVEGSYETTKRRGVEDDFVFKCKGRDVWGHMSVFDARIALFERELKAFRAARSRPRASTPTDEERFRSQDPEDWDFSGMTLAENEEAQTADQSAPIIFQSETAATIHGISHPIFQQIVEWAYTGSYRVPAGDVCDLLRAATFFEINRMEAKCEEYLADKITEENCLELCQLAELHTDPTGELHKAVLKFIADNFSTLSVTDKFMRFDCVASLKKLLTDDELNVANEAEVFEFLVKWTNHDRANRKNHFDSLLRCVRFYQFSPRFFHDVVCECDLITGSEEGRRRVEAVKNDLLKFVACQRSFAGTNDASLGLLLGVHVDIPRTSSIRENEMIICVGGSNTNGTNWLKSIELFDPARGSWRLANGEIQLRSGRSRMGVVCVGKKLFFVGGLDGKLKESPVFLSTVECLDLVSGELSSLASLRTARYGHALVALDEKWLFVIGGLNEDYLSSVERYDIAGNEWTEMAWMDAVRHGVAAAVYRGQIYVVGGFNGSALNSCERFFPIANRWMPMAPMLHKRFCCGLAVVGDYLYAIGGLYDCRCCERYSFAENKWTEIVPLSMPRQQLAVAVVGSSIFAIGGLNGRQASNTVEVYDTLSGDKWTQSAPLNEPRFNHGVACSSSQFTENF